jgi:hypothetical protein
MPSSIAIPYPITRGAIIKVIGPDQIFTGQFSWTIPCFDAITSKRYNDLRSIEYIGENMSELSKRSTIYFDPLIHQALRMRAAATHTSLSELIDEAVRLLMREDQEDMQAIADRVKEPEISYEVLLNDLKKHGKI